VVHTSANSGAAGGERVAKGLKSNITRQAGSEVGPAQKPVVEQTPAGLARDRGVLDELFHPDPASLIAGAGARVNPNSKERTYSMDGYEDSVYIDPDRADVDHLRETSRRRTSRPSCT